MSAVAVIGETTFHELVPADEWISKDQDSIPFFDDEDDDDYGEPYDSYKCFCGVGRFELQETKDCGLTKVGSLGIQYKQAIAHYKCNSCGETKISYMLMHSSIELLKSPTLKSHPREGAMEGNHC